VGWKVERRRLKLRMGAKGENWRGKWEMGVVSGEWKKKVKE
jgi:hypothetical protein